MPSAEPIEGQVLIFSIPGCPSCKRAKGLLTDLGLPWVEVDVEAHPSRRQDAVRYSGGRKTVPQIFFNGEHIGGFDDLEALQKAGKLDRLVELVRTTKTPPSAPRPSPPDEESSEEENLESLEGDPLATLATELRDSAIVCSHKQFFRANKKTFFGHEAVDWLRKEKGLSEHEAITTGNQLIDQHFITNLTSPGDKFGRDECLYRFVHDTEHDSLNMEELSTTRPRSALTVGSELRKKILRLYDRYLSADGTEVDYEGMATSLEFKDYVEATRQLQRLDLASLSRAEKLAFFINIYNALVVHAIVAVGPPNGMWARQKFFNSISYVMGGLPYSLNDIEHGVLRGNRKAPGALRKQFRGGDPRKMMSLSGIEPRIHFALVCGAKSCPPIKTYHPESLDDSLTLATESYLEQTTGLDPVRRVVTLSKLLSWYHDDFGNSDSDVLRFVASYISDQKRSKLLRMLDSGEAIKVTYDPYDWTVNKK